MLVRTAVAILTDDGTQCAGTEGHWQRQTILCTCPEYFLGQCPVG